ncbi:MAG: ribosome-associated translation inhibitor RaiA [Pyrinomonadaceae bacterium]
MKIELTGKHIEITPAIRSHVENHCNKLQQFFKGKTTAQAHIVVTVEKSRQKAEMVINWREHTLTAKETDKDLYQAINKAVEKLEKQARRLKEKVVDRKHSAQKAANVAPAPEGEISAAPLPPRIIISDDNELKPMTPEEAVLSLDGNGTQFIVFRDTETENLSVVYKRMDGNFGLIQP